MCTVKNNDLYKMDLALPPFTVFLIVEKLPSILTLNFQTSRFCAANLLEVGRKKIFSQFYGFYTPSNQNEVKYFIINVKTKQIL